MLGLMLYFCCFEIFNLLTKGLTISFCTRLLKLCNQSCLKPKCCYHVIYIFLLFIYIYVRVCVYICMYTPLCIYSYYSIYHVFFWAFCLPVYYRYLREVTKSHSSLYVSCLLISGSQLESKNVYKVELPRLWACAYFIYPAARLGLLTEGLWPAASWPWIMVLGWVCALHSKQDQ